MRCRVVPIDIIIVHGINVQVRFREVTVMFDWMIIKVKGQTLPVKEGSGLKCIVSPVTAEAEFLARWKKDAFHGWSQFWSV